MAEMKQVSPEPGTAPANPMQARIEKILISLGEQKYQEFARYRFAEEREWYESALFYQRRQWLRWNDSSRRWQMVKQNPEKPKPMPVSNYFAKAVNDNANMLQKVQVVATPTDDSDKNRQGARYAEKSIDAIDEESGFNVLRPLVAKHMVLWGIGITKDTYDRSISTGTTKLPVASLKSQWVLACADCGKTSDIEQPPPTGTAAGNIPPGADQLEAGNATSQRGQNAGDEMPGMPAGDQECPLCHSKTTAPYEKKTIVPAGTKQFTRGRITTDVPSIFEVYLPRNCRNANLAKTVVQRYREPLGKLRRLHPERAGAIKAEAPHDVHEIYMESLRALVNYNYMHEQVIETTTVTEMYSEWEELPKKVQDQLTQYWGQDQESFEQAQNCGIFLKYAGGAMLDWGPKEHANENPYTFYQWEIDPASAYNKGLAIDITPLQKRLNRIDSLIELAMMCNAAGKWLWPRTQTGKQPSGSPNEVIPYDSIGEGKNKPEFVSPTPVHQSAWHLREAIIQDFQRLANTMAVQQGQQPTGVKAFRAIAYLGAKAEESTGTQRMLWELGNQLRYRKVVRMAAENWDDQRKVRVAGYNGKFGMLSLTGEILQGDYDINFVPDSSRPRLIGEKQQAIAAALQAGLVDPTDSANREYLSDLLRLEQVNMVDHLQYLKAERDLETLRQGKLPMESPFQKWEIFLKVFANFTLTEEFEELDKSVQALILSYTQRMSDQLAAAQGTGAPPMQPPTPQNVGAALDRGEGAPSGGNPLSHMPGQDVSPQTVQGAAESEGAALGAHLP